jgi:tetratricopeptide (TPR) repeat protein
MTRPHHRTSPFPAAWPAVGPGRSVVVCACLLGCVALSINSPGSSRWPLGIRAAEAQPGLDPRGIPEDDPFADELNPFSREPAGKEAAPRQPAAAPPAARPKLQPAVPFPERTVPGEPAERRQSAADKARETIALPRPFEDVPDDSSDNPEESPAHELLVKAEQLDRAGKFAESRDLLRKAVKADPKLVVAHLVLGVVLRRLGDNEAAVESFSRGLVVDPEEPELYLRRGITWFHMGLHGIAMEDFEDAAGIAYEDPRPELWRGLTLMELDRPLEAINAYASAIRRDRTFMLAYLNRGLAYLATDEPRKAEFDFDQAIRHDPRNVRAWFNRGVALSMQGRYRDAAESYALALKIDPKHEPSRRNREAVLRMMESTARTSQR